MPDTYVGSFRPYTSAIPHPPSCIKPPSSDSPFDLDGSLRISNVPERLASLGSMSLAGVGSFGKVYRITPPTQYALKVIDCKDSVSRLTDALHEIEVMGRLEQCEHVVHLRDSEVVHTTGRHVAYLLLDYRTPLATYLGGRMSSLREICAIVTGVCDALVECRQAGVAHLDIQPKNIYVDGTPDNVYLGDFGNSLPLEDVEKNDRQRGSLCFMAPEMYRMHQASEQSDVYSVGMLLHCLLNCGTYPFAYEHGVGQAAYMVLAGTPLPAPTELHGHAADKALEVIAHAIAFDPAKRTSSIAELRREVKALLDYVEGLGCADLPIPMTGNIGLDMTPTVPSRTAREIGRPVCESDRSVCESDWPVCTADAFDPCDTYVMRS